MCLLAAVSGYPYFRDQIPNGKKVPHPCKPNYVWKGVGHENEMGGGDRNPFGRDWLANGKVRAFHVIYLSKFHIMYSSL